jgi:hypothetical protein
MKARGSIAKGLLIALAISLIPIPAISAQKVNPGSTCKVLNQKIVFQNKTYTCIKSGKKLVWNKGIFAKKSVPEPPQKVAVFSPVEVSLKSAKIENDLEVTYLSPINWGGLLANSTAAMKFPVTLKSYIDADIIRVLVQHSEGVQHIMNRGNYDWQYVKAGESKIMDLSIPLEYIERERSKGYTGGYTFKVFLNYKDPRPGEFRLEIPIDFVLPTQN